MTAKQAEETAHLFEPYNVLWSNIQKDYKDRVKYLEMIRVTVFFSLQTILFSINKKMAVIWDCVGIVGQII